MMKRMLILLAALLMLCCSAGAEDVYGKIDEAMYRIVLRTETEDVTLGSGVLFMDQSVVLTASACCVEGDLYAVGADGEHGVTRTELLGDSGAALLELEGRSPATPLALASEDAAALACIFSMNDKGEPIIAPLYQVRQSLYHDQEALLISAAEGLLPGGFLTDEKGHLVGLSVAQQAEGLGAYVCLDANALYAAMTRQQYAGAFLDVEAAWADGLLTLTWADEPRDGGCYLVTVSSEENLYYTFFETPAEDRSIGLSVPPEHTYYFQVQWAENAESAIEPIWPAMTRFAVPGGTFTAYGYTQECTLVTRVGKETAQPLTVITAASLTDPGYECYLQVTAAYDVEEKVELNMTIELIGPDGQFYYESAIAPLTPDREKKDTFLLPLDDLLADCIEFSGGSLLAGDYTLRYAIDGRIAGEFAFTLAQEGAEHQPQEEESAEAAVSGFVREISADAQSGLVTLSWSAEGIPEDAAVHAYYLYDGNPYYMYHRVNPGETKTEIFTIPGRDMMAWVVWTVGTQESLFPETQEDFVLISAEPEAAFTGYGFANQRMSVVPSADPAAAEAGDYLPEVVLTREILSDRSVPLYFQTEDTYQIDATSEDHPLAIVLCTPDGMCFMDLGMYIFDVTLQTSDQWLKDISSLFEDYESIAGAQAWPAGEYRILYCIDGQIAGEYDFTLE